ncbi:MAG: TetR/AcrR family transcriptional regulator [Myxococcota bacterium]
MPRPRSDIQPRILQAAKARFLAEGVDGASLRSIASDAETSIGMIYYYFPTKDDLFFAVVEEVYEAILRDLEAAIAPDVPVEARIERLCQRVARISETELSVMQLVAREALTSSARLERLVQRFMRGHVPLIAKLVGDGVMAGTFNPRLHPIVVMLSLAGISVVPQIIRRVIGSRLPLPLLQTAPQGEELAHELVRVLFHGVASEGVASDSARKDTQ